MGEPSIGGFAYSQNGGFMKSLNALEKEVLGGKLSAQGSVALVSYAAFIALAAFSPMIAARIGYSGPANVVCFSIVIGAFIAVYGINCLAVGGCKTLSWMYVALIAFSVVSALLASKLTEKWTQDVDERTADFTDSRLKPDVVRDLAPPLYAGQHTPGSPGDMAATSNALIIDQAKENLYEGYDAEGNEQGAPRPYVEGEMASA